MNDRAAIPFEQALDHLAEPDRSESKRLWRESLGFYQGLRDLREVLKKTEIEVAASLDITPAALSRLERQADIDVGTLRRAVASLGGEMEIIVRLPGRDPIRLGVAESEVTLP